MFSRNFCRLLLACVFPMSSLSGQLNGTYQIHPLATGSATHYRSLHAAIGDLMSGTRSDGGPANGPGMGGPVTLRLATNGQPLIEQVQIGMIPGISATRPLRITGGSSRAAIHAPVTTLAAPAVIQLLGARHIQLDSLTFVADDSQLAYGVHLDQHADSNAVSNCLFFMHPAPASIHVVGILIGQGIVTPANLGGSGNLVLRNEFKGGFWAVVAHPASPGVPVHGNRFVGNHVQGVRGYGFHLIGQDAVDVLDNVVEFEQNAIWGTWGIQLDHGGVLRCEGNRIVGARMVGLLFSSQNDTLGTAAPVCTVVNNTVSVAGSQGTGHGIYFGPNCHNYRVQHNSVAMGGGTGEVALAVGGCSNFDIRNNSLAVFPPASGLAAQVSGSSFTHFDFNAYHSPLTGGLIAYNGLTLGSGNYQGFMGENLHSVHGDPLYIDNLADLHSFGALLSGAGAPLVPAGIDFEGDVRDSLAPDIGADEYGLMALDLAVEGLLQPLSSTCPDSARAVYAVVRNLGAALSAPAPVYAQCAGVSTAALAGTTGAVLPTGGRDTVLLGYVSTLPGGSLQVQVWCSLAGDQNLGNDSLSESFLIGMQTLAPTVLPQGFCVGDSGVIHATSQGGQLSWYDAAQGGNLQGQGDSLPIGVVGMPTTYWVEAVDSLVGHLATTWAGGLRGQGDMWTVEALRDLQIDTLDLHVADTALHSFWLYGVPGSYAGLETTAGAWTLLATGLLQGAGQGQPTHLPLSGLSLAGGQTYSFYVRLDSGVLSHSPCPGIYANPDLRISTGTHLAAAFAAPVPGRTWNGRVRYTAVTCASVRVPVPVQAIPLPVVSLGADLLLCDSASAVLDAGNPGASFLWSSGAQTQQIAISMPGLYTVQVSVQGCSSRDTIAAMAGSAPLAFATWTASGSQGVQFIDMSQGATSWQWDFGDGSPVDSSQYPMHMYATPGTYNISLTVSNGCGSAIWQEVLVITSLEAPLPSPVFTCWPNPFAEILYVQGEVAESCEVEIILSDLQGRLLDKWHVNWRKGSNRSPMDMSAFSVGTYLIYIKAAGQVRQTRVVHTR
jgi:PKD domain/Ig-like domain CHU_C associated